MQFKIFQTGIYDVNTYLIWDEKSKEAAVVDYGGACSELLDEVNKQGLHIKYILNTHAHFDHISGEKSLQDLFKLPVYLHKNDLELANLLEVILAGFGVKPEKPPIVTNFLTEESELSLGDIQIKVIETPGHTQGGVCFLVEDSLFSGDTLFYESIGRTDLPGGSSVLLQQSIKNKLFTLDEATKIYPGHGCPSTIGHEKLNNPFVI